MAINWMQPQEGRSSETDHLQPRIQRITCNGSKGRKSLLSTPHLSGSQSRHFHVLSTQYNTSEFPKGKYSTLASSLPVQSVTDCMSFVTCYLSSGALDFPSTGQES